MFELRLNWEAPLDLPQTFLLKSLECILLPWKLTQAQCIFLFLRSRSKVIFLGQQVQLDTKVISSISISKDISKGRERNWYVAFLTRKIPCNKSHWRKTYLKGYHFVRTNSSICSGDRGRLFCNLISYYKSTAQNLTTIHKPYERSFE